MLAVILDLASDVLVYEVNAQGCRILPLSILTADMTQPKTLQHHSPWPVGNPSLHDGNNNGDDSCLQYHSTLTNCIHSIHKQTLQTGLYINMEV